MEARNETRISYLEASISKILQNIDRLEEHIITSREAKPFNWLGFGSLVITIMLAFGGVFTGLVSYSDYRDAEQAKNLVSLRAELKSESKRIENQLDLRILELRATQEEKITSLDEFKSYTHYEVGVMHARATAVDNRLESLERSLENIR